MDKRQKQQKYQREWYKRNKKTQKVWIRKRLIELSIWFRELKSRLTCIRCGENHPATLDFHHRDPSSKVAAVSEGVRDGWKRERILAEIEKCDVLCANCHRKEHYVPV